MRVFLIDNCELFETLYGIFSSNKKIESDYCKSHFFDSPREFEREVFCSKKGNYFIKCSRGSKINNILPYNITYDINEIYDAIKYEYHCEVEIVGYDSNRILLLDRFLKDYFSKLFSSTSISFEKLYKDEYKKIDDEKDFKALLFYTKFNHLRKEYTAYYRDGIEKCGAFKDEYSYDNYYYNFDNSLHYKLQKEVLDIFSAD